MIRTIDIRLNAAHPELPLPEATTYQGAPSTAFLRGVPKACGQWQITAVSVAVTFPDNSTTTRAAVLSAGDVWVVTIPACATSGRTVSGLRILADGLDENGDAVTGYVLGVADLAVATFDIAPAPGVTSYALRYFDNVPNPPHKGDVAKVDNVLKYYDGTAWQPFAAVPSPSTSAPQMDGTASAGTSAAYARGDHVHPTDTSRMAATATGADIAVSGTDATKISAALAGKASTADATLTERGFTAWEVTPATFQGQPIEIRWVDATQYGYPGYSWEPFAGSQMLGGAYNENENATTFYCESTISEVGGPISATRTALQGYQLGTQADKPLASEAEAEALRTGKANRAANPTAGNLAALDAQGNPTDAGWTAGELARYSLVAKTIDNGAVTLDDRAINAVAVSSSLASLTINFPAATSGKVRDFGLRLTVASGITTAPQIVLPQGVVCENADGAAPEIGADGAATILYFTETASGVFLVKGEQVQPITQ